jgi:hypothetical protein
MEGTSGYKLILNWWNSGLCNKDAIRKILNYLTKTDWELVLIAHNSQKEKHVSTIIPKLCYTALSNGYTDLFVYAAKNKCFWDYTVFEEAAANGRLETLKWLDTNEYPLYINNYKLCAWAAKGGHLETLKWLNEKGCPWDEWCCSGAAETGNLEVLKWLRKKGCPWDWRTCAIADENGHYEVLQWAIDNGCQE